MDDTNFDTKKARRQFEVTGVVRRRRWNAAEKGRIVAEAVAPGAVIAEVARRHDLTPQHLSNWIRAAKDGHFALPGEVEFVPVVSGEMAKPAAASNACMCCNPVIEVSVGAIVVRVRSGTDPSFLRSVLDAIRT